MRYLCKIDGHPMHPFDHDYTKISIKYDLPLISSLFEFNDCLFLYKIKSGIIKCTELKALLPENTNTSVNTRNKIPFYLSHTDLNYIKNQPINRICQLGNELIKKNKHLVNFDTDINIAYNLIRKQFIAYKVVKKQKLISGLN